jgi:tight adherence protein B
MRRRLAIALATAAAVSVLAPTRAAAGLELAPAGKPEFPKRSFALTLPSKRPLSAGQVAVLENNTPVPRISLVPGTSTGEKQLGVILVVDASDSMHGEAIVGATEAARRLAARRNVRQPLGIVTFNRRPATLLAPTSDTARIDAALAEPPGLVRGTHIYDAVAAAIRLLERAGISGGSVVVLSDGSDTGSRLTVDDVTASARQAGVRLYSVGLRSSAFEPGPLRDLADSGGGSYSEATSVRSLAGIYDRLGKQLANQYLIRYRSEAGPSESVHVWVSVAGVPGIATADYTTPALQLPARPAFHRPLDETFWRSDAALIVVSLAMAGLIALALAVLLRPRSRTRSLRRRIEAFAYQADRREAAPLTAVADRLVGQTETSLERTSWWPGVKQEIEVARIPIAPAQLAALTILGTIVAVWVVGVVTGSALAALAGLATPLFVRMGIRLQLKRERSRFADQLADHLQVVASAMRAGHSFMGALSVANNDAPEPTRLEFERAVADERLGVPPEEALDAIRERMDCPDMAHAALVAKLQRQTGASAAEVLERVAATIRERQELRRHIRALTAQQRIARWVLTGLPIALLAVLTVVNPDYISPLFEEPSGRVLLALGAAGMITGSYLLKRLVEIDV